MRKFVGLVVPAFILSILSLNSAASDAADNNAGTLSCDKTVLMRGAVSCPVQ